MFSQFHKGLDYQPLYSSYRELQPSEIEVGKRFNPLSVNVEFPNDADVTCSSCTSSYKQNHLKKALNVF